MPIPERRIHPAAPVRFAGLPDEFGVPVVVSRRARRPLLIEFAIDGRGLNAYSRAMALINCPECGKQVSTEAQTCPACGYPIAQKLAQTPAIPPAGDPLPATQTQVLAEIRPSWWGFFWHLFFFWLIIPPFVAYFRRASTVLRVYPQRVTVERGIFSKCYQDLNPRDIRSIDVDQSFFQRLVGIGTLTLSTAATVDAAEELRSIPDPKAVRDLILAQRGAQ